MTTDKTDNTAYKTDPNLSVGAKWVLFVAHNECNPNKFSRKEINAFCRSSHTTIQKYFTELKNNNYITWTQNHDGDGRRQPVFYTVDVKTETTRCTANNPTIPRKQPQDIRQTTSIKNRDHKITGNNLIRPQDNRSQPIIASIASKHISNPIYKEAKQENKILSDLAKNSKVKRKSKKVENIIAMKKMINVYTTNNTIKELLKEYFNIRQKKGLTPKQWEMILADLRKFSGSSAKAAINYLENSIMGGYMTLIPPWEKKPGAVKSYSGKQRFEPGIQEQDNKPVADLTPEEKIEWQKTLDRDDDGKLITY